MNYENMKIVLEKIKEYDTIMLFRHVRNDGDCVGATTGLKEIIRLLSITSNNVNQMARQLNRNNTIYPQELTEVEAQLEQIYKLLRKVMRGISKIK